VNISMLIAFENFSCIKGFLVKYIQPSYVC
jgi:hypothetical protein